MKAARTILMLTAVLALAVTAARADWDPGMPYKMHWPQLPDLSPTGLDVLDTWDYQGQGTEKFLADDFQCTGSGPITDIHIWGSWLNDETIMQPHFYLKIYKDIPASESPTGYSMPGEMLWESPFGPADQVRAYARDLQEGFYDPNLGEVIGNDTVCWQYNFYFDEAAAFPQVEGDIYWLGVEAFYEEPDLWNWGWKTTNPRETEHFNDDAVYIDLLPDGTASLWQELRYPVGHPYAGESMDLAFVITPEPATLALMGLGAAGLVASRRRRRQK
ncbi:MAG: PEP-CTERM sorting domain-containing protein [Phycisphaerae bacterium]